MCELQLYEWLRKSVRERVRERGSVCVCGRRKGENEQEMVREMFERTKR